MPKPPAANMLQLAARALSQNFRGVRFLALGSNFMINSGSSFSATQVWILLGKRISMLKQLKSLVNSVESEVSFRSHWRFAAALFREIVAYGSHDNMFF